MVKRKITCDKRCFKCRYSDCLWDERTLKRSEEVLKGSVGFPDLDKAAYLREYYQRNKEARDLYTRAYRRRYREIINAKQRERYAKRKKAKKVSGKGKA